MANPLTKVILGNIASKKNPKYSNKTVDYSEKNLSPNEEETLISIINKKEKTEKRAINKPHKRTIVTLAELGGKKTKVASKKNR